MIIEVIMRSILANLSKLVMRTCLILIWAPLIYASGGGQFNGNVLNNTDQNIYICVMSGGGGYSGPGTAGNGNPEMIPHSSSGYSQTSSSGIIGTSIYASTVNDFDGDCNSSGYICDFGLRYDGYGGGGYSYFVNHKSFANNDCSISVLNGCTSCLNLNINSTSIDTHKQKNK